MEEQTPVTEGEASPTPEAEMSSNDSAQNQADQNEAKPAEETKPESQKVIEQVLGREFGSLEEATESIKNLNSLVGDQTISKQRKALEKMAKQSNMTPEELIEVIETQDSSLAQENQEAAPTPAVVADPTLAKVTRIEVESFIDKQPGAKEIKDALFAEALQTGTPVPEIWKSKYGKTYNAGKKLGAKKLQTTLEGQPLRAESADTEQSDTKLSFKGLNPATGKPWTRTEIETSLGYIAPSRGL